MMQVYLCSMGQRQPLELKNQKINILPVATFLEIFLEEGECATLLNNGDEYELRSGNHEFRVQFDSQNQSLFKLKHNNSLCSFIFVALYGRLIDEQNIENLMHFSESLLSIDNGNTDAIDVNILIDAIETGKVTLLNVVKPLTGYDNEVLLTKLKESLAQKVRAICSSPKQGIKADELVQEVSLVKRINNNTIRHLSSHTEHWKNRTLSGLVPNRLKADIIEDEINIYENLFFKMAIDDISDYVTDQINSVRAAQKTNKIAIDWEKYGAEVNDYQRSQLIHKLLPGKNTSQLSSENRVFDIALQDWMGISKILLTIKGSSFYKSISKKKRISKSVHLTNILKNDQRYKALYDLWCLVQKERQKNTECKKGITGNIAGSLPVFYYNYVSTAFIFSMHLLGINFMPGSTFQMTSDGLNLSVNCEDDVLLYSVTSKTNKMLGKYISLEIKQKNGSSFEIPTECNYLLFNRKLEKDLFTLSDRKIVFHRQPTSTEFNDLLNAFHISQSEAKRLSFEKKQEYKKSQDYWTSWVNDNRSKIKEIGKTDLNIYPFFFKCEHDAKSVIGFTDNLFKIAEGRNAFLLPLDFAKFREISDEKTLRRLYNYGEAFDKSESVKWKNYQLSVLPVNQTDIGSVQRLLKLVSLQKTLCVINWEKDEPIHCPVCESTSIKVLDANTWCCQNPECKINWGLTKCDTICKEYFAWIRPGQKIKKAHMLSHTIVDEILKKDSLLDRFTITDFEFEAEESLEYISKMYPVCPKCGGRRNNL